MIEDITVQHVTFTSDRAFDEVVRLFEEQVGDLEVIGWPAFEAASSDGADFEHRVEGIVGPSGFTRFLSIDHGKWVTKQGFPARFMMYVLGNPLIAITMMRHHLEAGLDVPVRLAIYEDQEGKTKVVFNTPSSLMSGLGNPDVQAAALKLDAKMVSLAEVITGIDA